MSKWFYYNESGEKIEVTGGQLKGLAKTGMITPDTKELGLKKSKRRFQLRKYNRRKD